jgi:hypothetical protein
MISYNTLLKFYRSFLPETKAREKAKEYMKLQARYYRGKKE